MATLESIDITVNGTETPAVTNEGQVSPNEDADLDPLFYNLPGDTLKPTRKTKQSADVFRSEKDELFLKSVVLMDGEGKPLSDEAKIMFKLAYESGDAVSLESTDDSLHMSYKFLGRQHTITITPKDLDLTRYIKTVNKRIPGMPII
jgi:hypothetical protein